MRNPNLIYLYLDDERSCPTYIMDKYSTITIRDAQTAIDTIEYFASIGTDICIDFDHDLGEEKSGYDIAKYIVENQISITGYKVHSMNSVGSWNIHQLMEHYGYGRFEA